MDVSFFQFFYKKSNSSPTYRSRRLLAIFLLKENERWNFNATLKSNDVRFCYPEKSVITTKEGKNSDTPGTETTSPQK